MQALKNVIAERELELTMGDKKRKVVVRLAAPFPVEHGFRCDYQILGLGDDKVRFGTGIDGIQALQIALQNIGADLYLRHREVSLLWEGDSDLGFPKPLKWM